jgi:hypothetical protein
MTWWNETSAHWGWTGCLLAAVVLLGFWGAVFAAISVLLGTSKVHPRRDSHAACPDRAARPAGITIPAEPVAAAPPRRS